MRYSILGTWTTLGDPTNVHSHVWGEVSNISNDKYCRGYENIQKAFKLISN